MKTQVSLSAHSRYLIASDLVAFVLITIVLLAVFLIPTLLSLLAFSLLSLCVGIGFGVDIALWFRRGIRSVELDDEALTLYRGKELVPRRIERKTVGGVAIRRVIGRRSAVVRLSDGKRVRIPEDAFPPEAFARFLAALESWR
jgi:hypothetical protein